MGVTGQAVFEALQALTRQQGGAGYCVIADAAGERYIQFVGGSPDDPGGATTLSVEVSSGAHPDPRDRFTLSPDAVEDLLAAGFHRPEEAGAPDGTLNFWADLTVASAADLQDAAAAAMRILQDILGADPATATLELELNL